MKRILVPTDFSEAAHNAYLYAIQLAEVLGASVTLLHVYPDNPVVRDWEAPPVIDLLRANKVEEALLRFREYAKEGQELFGKRIGAEIEIESGRADWEIINRSETGEADLIVMGTQGQNSMAEKVFGSVTAQVLQLSKCPVLAVPGNATYRPIRHITYATTFHEKDFDYIEQLLALADKLDASISCTKVKPFEGKWEKLEYGFLEKLIRYKGRWHMLEFYTMSGDDVVKGLESFAKEREVDVIAILTHRRDLVGRLFDPGVAKELAYITSVPVLVFHE